MGDEERLSRGSYRFYKRKSRRADLRFGQDGRRRVETRRRDCADMGRSMLRPYKDERQRASSEAGLRKVED